MTDASMPFLLVSLAVHLMIAPSASYVALAGVAFGVGYAFFDGQGFADVNQASFVFFAAWLYAVMTCARSEERAARALITPSAFQIPIEEPVDDNAMIFDDVNCTALLRAHDALASGDVASARREIDWLIEDCEAMR